MTPQAAIKAERKRQADFMFIYWAGNAFFGLFWAMLYANSWAVIPTMAMLAQFGYVAHTWPILQADFAEATKKVAFLVNVEPLFVFSKQPGDITVAERVKEARQILEDVGNAHECPIWYVLFRDVSAFGLSKTGYISEPRPDGCASESWEQYQLYCQTFAARKREEWLRKLRKNKEATDWVNETIFEQN